MAGGLDAKLCLTLVTPWTVACQAPLSMGFSRQEYWSGLPFPSPRIFPSEGSNPHLLNSQVDSLSCLTVSLSSFFLTSLIKFFFFLTKVFLWIKGRWRTWVGYILGSPCRILFSYKYGKRGQSDFCFLIPLPVYSSCYCQPLAWHISSILDSLAPTSQESVPELGP